jgi:hypothetical protein
MKKVGGSTAPATFSLDTTHTTVGGVSMKRSGSSGSEGLCTISFRALSDDDIVNKAPSGLPIRQKDGPIHQSELIQLGKFLALICVINSHQLS